MEMITVEESAPQTMRSAPASRPLTRKQMSHQRPVEWRRPGHEPTVGMLLYRPTPDDEHAKWLVVPMRFGSVTVMPVPWSEVAAGEFFRTGPRVFSVEDERNLVRWFRRHHAEHGMEVKR
ncbi:hypothetical protein [Streptomyces sp. NPDC058157]|uniref:hypothetical protein n=1 Tax=Streptomyces sp. NPDC058157 TaxID=3346360 RepID=UPI0036E21A79